MEYSEKGESGRILLCSSEGVRLPCVRTIVVLSDYISGGYVSLNDAFKRLSDIERVFGISMNEMNGGIVFHTLTESEADGAVKILLRFCEDGAKNCV